MSPVALAKAVDKLMDTQEFKEADIETQLTIMNLAPLLIRYYLDAATDITTTTKEVQ